MKSFSDYKLEESRTESGELFKSLVDRAHASSEAGNHTQAKRHLANAQTARYGITSGNIAKHKKSFDKYKELKHAYTNSDEHVREDISIDEVKHPDSVDEHIVKVGSEYELKSHTGKNLGKSPTKAGAEKRERQVNYFKHANEEVELDEISQETKSSYVTKATADVADRRAKEKNALSDNGKRRQHYPEFKAHVKKTDKREKIVSKMSNEEVELDEASSRVASGELFKHHLDKATEASKNGAHNRAKYHLGIAQTARYGITHQHMAKHKASFDKYKELMHSYTNSDDHIREDISIDEAHKINDRVEIIKGSSKGTVGHIGEIRHGLYKGAPKEYTVYHGEHGATRVKKEHIRKLKEEVEELDELSNKLLNRYSKKAEKEAGKNFMAADRAQDRGNYDKAQTHMDKADKRASGVYKAQSKIKEATAHDVIKAKLDSINRTTETKSPAQKRAEAEKLAKEKAMKEAVDTIKKNDKGEVISFSHEGDWEKSSTKNGGVARGRGKAANAAGKGLDTIKKLTKEEVEEFMQTEAYDQLDELSKKTLGNYIKKAADSLSTNAMVTGFNHAKDNIGKNKSGRNAENRRYGIQTAADKLAKEEVELEEVETLDELSKGTLGSYVNKASKQVASASRAGANHEHGFMDALTKSDENKAGEHYDAATANRAIAKKRLGGIGAAVKRLAKEEYVKEAVDLDTIKKEYKSNEDSNNHSENAVLLAKHFGSKSDQNKATKAINHRDAHNGYGADPLGRHYSKMSHEVHSKLYHHIKEETLDELSKATLGSYVKKASGQAASASVTAKSSELGANNLNARGVNPRLADLQRKNAEDSKALAAKRTAGVSKAVDKLTKEEVELVENDLKTLFKHEKAAGFHPSAGESHYARKVGNKIHIAAHDDDNGHYTSSFNINSKGGGDYSVLPIIKHKSKAEAIAAVNKKAGVKEEVELDEISKELANRYYHKASNAAMDARQDKENPLAFAPSKKKFQKTFDKRVAGMKAAGRRQSGEFPTTNEDTMLTYSEFMAQLAEGKADDLKDKQAADREARMNNYDYSKEKDKKSNKTIVRGHSYGAGDEEGEGEDDKKTAKPEAVKRGRGRPVGTKSGARV